MAKFTVYLYRSNILSFTDRYNRYYSKKKLSVTKLKCLFRDQVLGSLNVVRLAKWNLPRFIFSSDDKDFVINKHHLPDIEDKQIINEILSSKESNTSMAANASMRTKKSKKYAIKLSTKTKQKIVKTLKSSPFIYCDKDKEGKNFIIGINLIPHKGHVRDLFDFGKENCGKCHAAINKDKTKLYSNDKSLPEHHKENYNLDRLNGAVVFEIPIKE